MSSTTAAPAATAVPRHDSALAVSVGKFCLEGHTAPAPEVRKSLNSSPLWKAVADAGTALWLDTGDADATRKLWTREFTALTTNNTLLNKEVQKGIYDTLVPRAAQVLRAAEPKLTPEELVEEIAFILNAVHGLKLVRTFDADVSVELHTNRSRDTEGSYQYGKRFAAICPDRFIVKVPLTPEGVLAARKLVNDKIRVNFTLGFSARQNGLIATVARPAFVNVFMGRLNSFFSDQGLGDGKNVGEKATLASQRLLKKFNAAKRANVRQIGASIRNGQQCFDLAGLDVLTIPTAAAEDFQKLNPPLPTVKNRTGEDPAVTLKEGRDLAKERLDIFWQTDGPVAKACAAMEKVDLDVLTGDGLRAFLRKHGAGDLFPDLSKADVELIQKDGKIPTYTRWKDRVQAGTASWDGLFTEAAIGSFSADQKQLDDRIRKFL